MGSRKNCGRIDIKKVAQKSCCQSRVDCEATNISDIAWYFQSAVAVRGIGQAVARKLVDAGNSILGVAVNGLEDKNGVNEP